MNKLKKFTYFSIPLIILAIIAAFFFDAKTVIVVLLSLLLLGAYIIYKEKIGQELIIAFLISIAWTSYYFYEYTTPNLIIGKINLFPFVAWTSGLVLLREIYERLKGKYKFIKISVFYIIVLLIIEYIGYHLLGIKLNSNFPSLLGLGVIHAPLVLKIFYILAGPVYILITDYLKVK